jgi:acyl-CoA thioesterase I
MTMVLKSLFHRFLISSFIVAFAFFNSVCSAGEVTADNGAVAASAAPPVRVACVGDSITYGYGLKNRTHNSYPAWLGRWLDGGYDVRNFGVNGATLLHKGDIPYFKQKAYTEALAFKPNIVIIMLGTNDSKHRGPGSLDAQRAINNWQYKADYVPNYEELIAAFRKANPGVTIYVCLPTPCFPGRWGINGKTIHDEVIPMVRKVAKVEHAKIIDLYHALPNKKFLLPDTVHPNDAGAKLVAAAVYRALTGKAPPTAAENGMGSRRAFDTTTLAMLATR